MSQKENEALVFNRKPVKEKKEHGLKNFDYKKWEKFFNKFEIQSYWEVFESLDLDKRRVFKKSRSLRGDFLA